jgi:gp32 DNA binding protein like
MSSDFATLKKSTVRDKEMLTEKLDKAVAPSFNPDDDRFWQPEVDKQGNGFAIIRFLPAPKGEDVPFVRLWEHRFKGPTGSWYIEKCLTTLGKDDPVAQLNNVLWNSGLESDKQIARDRKRQLYFISNIYIIKDPQKPENEGKVFLYRYGKKIFDKLNDLMHPAAGDEQINPFDLWSGANFKLRIKPVESFRNYDSSAFDAPSPLNGDDKELEKIWNLEHPLQPFIAEKSFKTYDVLKTKLDRVLGTNKARAHDDNEPTSKPLVPFGEHNDHDEDDEEVNDRLKFFEKMKRDVQ